MTADVPFDELMSQATHGVVDFPAQWGQGRAIFGGAVAGAAVTRLLTQVSDRPLRSLQVQFAAPVAPEQTNVDVRIVRAGNSMVHGHADVRQGTQTCCVVTASFGIGRASAVPADEPAMPANLDRNDTHQLPYIEGVVPVFTQNFELRWVGSNFPFTDSRERSITGFVRHRTQASGVAGVVAAIDAWPAPVLPTLSKPAFASSVTWSLELCRGDVAANQWFVYRSQTSWTEGGYSRFDSTLWTETGDLVATSSQLVAVFA